MFKKCEKLERKKVEYLIKVIVTIKGNTKKNSFILLTVHKNHTLEHMILIISFLLVLSVLHINKCRINVKIENHKFSKRYIKYCKLLKTK